MSRFIYIADTHVGTDKTGYKQQAKHPEMLPEIIAALRELICADGHIDFVLHGGDMIDETRSDTLTQAAMKMIMRKLFFMNLCSWSYY